MTVTYNATISMPPPTLVGPLTTTFTPPRDCATPFNWPGITDHLQLEAYGLNCVTERACFPGTDTAAASLPLNGYFSPGLYCPLGWTTAATIDSRVPELLSQLKPDESAAVCCPSGYELYVYWPILYCTREPNYQDDRHYHFCEYTGSSDTSFLTTYPATTEATTTSVFMLATPIQLNWRAVDRTSALSSAQTATETSGTTALATTSDPPNHGNSPSALSTPQLAGAVVGGVVGMLLCVAFGLFLILKLRRKRRVPSPGGSDDVVDEGKDKDAHLAPEVDTRPNSDLTLRQHPHRVSELGSSEIAEKDGTALPSPCPTFELDGTERAQLP